MIDPGRGALNIHGVDPHFGGGLLNLGQRESVAVFAATAPRLFVLKLRGQLQEAVHGLVAVPAGRGASVVGSHCAWSARGSGMDMPANTKLT